MRRVPVIDKMLKERGKQRNHEGDRSRSRVCILPLGRRPLTLPPTCPLEPDRSSAGRTDLPVNSVSSMSQVLREAACCSKTDATSLSGWWLLTPQGHFRWDMSSFGVQVPGPMPHYPAAGTSVL